MQLARAPYVLALPADLAGCGYHRILHPMEVMVRAAVVAGRAEMQFPSPQQVGMWRPDVVVVQRWNEPKHIEYLRMLRAAVPGVHIVYEVDDALSLVPEESWHHSFMPSGIDAACGEVMRHCDVVTTTTEALARHIRGFAGETEVRVIPNMLSSDDFDVTAMTRRRFMKKGDRIPRVGWGGSVSHHGDLALLSTAMREIKGIQWVFLGMTPKVPPGVENYEVYPGVQPQQYLTSLASLDLDLMVAPLQDNGFNRCKSNLRLIEAAACGYPVVASPVEPYLQDAPPLLGYASTEAEWVEAVQTWVTSDRSKAARSAAALTEWGRRKFCFDSRLQERVEAWLPRNNTAFMPSRPAKDGPIVVCGKLGTSTLIGAPPLFTDLGTAIREGSGDIIFIRDGTLVPDNLIELLSPAAAHNVATVSALTNDAVPYGFPQRGKFTDIDAVGGTRIADLAASLQSDPMEMETSAGPVVLITRAGITAFGPPQIPDDATPSMVEFCIVEWSAAASCRGFRNLLVPQAYAVAVRPLLLNEPGLSDVMERTAARWHLTRKDPTAIIDFIEQLELRHHRSHYKAMVAKPTDYPSWASRYVETTPRQIKAAFDWVRETNGDRSITIRSCDNDADLAAAILDTEVDWLQFSPPGSTISLLAPAYLTEALAQHPTANVFYADHDLIQDGIHNGPDLKPSFDHHLLLGRDYVSQICWIRRSAAVLSGADHHRECSEPVLAYEIVLGIIALCGRETIHHIPRVLASLPLTAAIIGTPDGTSAKAGVANRHASLLGWGLEVKPIRGVNYIREVSYIPHRKPMVSIIIPTGGKADMLEPCLRSLIDKTSYPNFEIIVVHNGERTPECESILADFAASIRVDYLGPLPGGFNWSKINNDAVRLCSGEMLCFMNDDVRVIDEGWLDEMVGAALIPEVGTVGAKLQYPNGLIQHVGVVCHRGATGHYHKGTALTNPGYNGIAACSHEATAVTAACMVCRRDVYDRIGGFREDFAHNFNDVIFGLEAMRAGFRNVVAIRAQLQHLEGMTRTSPVTPEGARIQVEEGQRLGTLYPDDDPYWNPNLAFFLLQNRMLVAGTDFSLLRWPPPAAPWAGEEIDTKILVVGRITESIIEEIRDGAVVYQMEKLGHLAKIVQPPMENLRPFDLRDEASTVQRLQALGVSKIVVTSSGDHGPSPLHLLTRCGVPVLYRPTDAEMICPRGDLTRAGEPCGGGWASPGACQACVDQHGSPRGYVNTTSWLLDWLRFAQQHEVSIELDAVPQEQAAAIAEVLQALPQQHAEAAE